MSSTASDQYLPVESQVQRGFGHVAWALLVYSIFVILWGAYVRATLSGAGCGDHWPLCDGEVVPSAPSTEKAIEFTHRVTSGIAWIWALVMAILGFSRGEMLRRASLRAFFFMTTEALVGAGIVLTKMVADNPDVYRGFWAAAHLINTFFLLSALTRLAFIASTPLRPSAKLLPLSRWHTVIAFCFVIAAATGAIAALGDTLFPSQSLAEGIAADFDSASHLFVRLRWLHPAAALVTAFVIGRYALGLALDDSEVSKLGRALLLLVLFQIALGLLNLMLLAPIWLQLVHLLMADIAWIVFVVITLKTRLRLAGTNL